MSELVKRSAWIVLLVMCAAVLSLPVHAQYRQEAPRFSPIRDLSPAGTAVSISSTTSDRPVFGQMSADQVSAPEPTADIIQLSPEEPVSPAGALYRSLVLPGWGQWKNGRKGKALLFALAEAVCIGGYLYENARYTSGDYTGPEKEAVKTDRNSFLLYWMIAKVLDIMDAYVDAQFQTYDVDDITPPELVN